MGLENLHCAGSVSRHSRYTVDCTSVDPFQPIVTLSTCRQVCGTLWRVQGVVMQAKSRGGSGGITSQDGDATCLHYMCGRITSPTKRGILKTWHWARAVKEIETNTIVPLRHIGRISL